MLRPFLPVMCVLSFTTSLLAANWPTYLNGNARVGATSESLPRELHLQWIYEAPGDAIELAWSGPRAEPIEGHVMRHRVAFVSAIQVAAVGDRLYFGSSVDHQIYCVDARTGTTLWSRFTEGPIRLCPTVWDDKVYVGSDDGHVYCLRAADGELLWKFRAGLADERILARGRMISRWPVRTNVLIDNGVAYFGAGVIPHETVFLCALDALTGAVVWQNDHISQEDAGRNDLSPQGYLLATDDLLIVPSGRNLPAAFDKRTGEQVHSRKYSWRTTAGGVVGGSKAMLADGQIYASGPHHFLAMDQQTGAVGYAYVTGRQITLSGEKAFVATGREIVALDRPEHVRATRQRQTIFLQQRDLPSQRGKLSAAEYRQRAEELDAEYNRLSKIGNLWTVESTSDAALICAGDAVYAGGQDVVTAYDADSGKQRWQQAVSGTANGLAVANGFLYVSTDQGKIYAFGAAPAEKVVRHRVEPHDVFERDEKTAVYEAFAQRSLERTGVRDGFCLVVGSESGRLAAELARQSNLRVYGIEADAQKVAASRAAFQRAGHYGRTVTILHADPERLPVSNYFANLVVSESMLTTGTFPGDLTDLCRRVKPCGGFLCYAGRNTELLEDVMKAMPSEEPLHVTADSELTVVRRGKLPGAGSWSHQYGDPSNVCYSYDYRVKDGLGVLWYGDPGPAKMVNRHEGAHAPLATNGRMFIQGIDSIMAYDAYNGTFLWEYKNPGAVRTGVFNNEDTSNIAASDDHVFVAVEDKCTVLDAATGEAVGVHAIPEPRDNLPRGWSFVAHYDGLLMGASAIRSELERSLRRRGLTVKNTTDAVFAVDTAAGERIWEYRGENVMHQTIAIGDGRVFFIESTITQAEREALLRQDKTELKKLSPEEAARKEAELKKIDARTAVALDVRTGEKLWSVPVDVTNCSRVSIGGGQLTLMYHDQHVLICGANANGHFWRQFLSGDFSRRRLLVLDASDGAKKWAKDADYRHRPIIVGDEIIAEPWGFDLATGKQKTRRHPVTGEETAWQFSRPGHHCGAISATPNMLFFRSGFTAYYDLYGDSGVSHFAGQRTGCWINAIPGNGLLMVPEASAGCVCQFSLAATIVMEPRTDRENWRIFSAAGPQLPVKELALNLGGPGDRRDQFGQLWLAYPRPALVGRLEYDFKLATEFSPTGKFVAGNAEAEPIEGVDVPWLYASAARNLQKCVIPLLGEKDPAARYTVTLHFAPAVPSASGAVQIRLQNATVETALESTPRPVSRVFSDIAVERDLVVEITAPEGQEVNLAAIEIQRLEK